MLGQDIAKLSSALSLSKDDCDITDFTSIQHIIETQAPSIIINCAAYTAVDLAEKESNMAYQINSLGARNVAKACANADIPLIHISTDYVFDGEKNEPYQEEDPCHPMSVYGKSKHEGEIYIQEILPQAKIIRTQWLYGHGGKNFVETMLRLGQTRRELSIIDDQIGSPTNTHDLAKAILTIQSSPAGGIFHVRNSGFTSWYGFAKEIFMRSNISCMLKPIPTREYPLPAKRPLNSRLSMARWKKELGLPELSHWKISLQDYLNTRQIHKDDIE